MVDKLGDVASHVGQVPEQADLLNTVESSRFDSRWRGAAAKRKWVVERREEWSESGNWRDAWLYGRGWVVWAGGFVGLSILVDLVSGLPVPDLRK